MILYIFLVVFKILGLLPTENVVPSVNSDKELVCYFEPSSQSGFESLIKVDQASTFSYNFTKTVSLESEKYTNIKPSEFFFTKTTSEDQFQNYQSIHLRVLFIHAP